MNYSRARTSILKAISIKNNNKITVKKDKLKFLIFIILEKLDIEKNLSIYESPFNYMI